MACGIVNDIRPFWNNKIVNMLINKSKSLHLNFTTSLHFRPSLIYSVPVITESVGIRDKETCNHFAYALHFEEYLGDELKTLILFFLVHQLRILKKQI